MSRRIAALAAAWRRLWARERLPAPPGRLPEGGVPSPAGAGRPGRSIGRALLASGTLPSRPADGADRPPGFLGRLLARERLPAAPADPSDRSPSFLGRLLSRESLPRGGDAPVDPPRTPE